MIMRMRKGIPDMVRKKKTDEYEGRIKHALIVLGETSNDNTTPRNIRRAATDSMDSLNNTKFTVAVRAANAVNILDEFLQDVNMPPILESDSGML
jgi:uncharacterized protein